MHNPRRDSFVIEVITDSEEGPYSKPPSPNYFNFNFNLSAMKLFNRFRKVLMRLVFSAPSTACKSGKASSKHKNADRFEPPKTSCSSYYSSYSHYNEAIADCIEFFNKSAQDGLLDGRKSDVV